MPARAAALANRLAVGVGVLMSRQKTAGRPPNPFKNSSQHGKRPWVNRLEDLFLDALKFVVQVRQLKTSTELVWPEKNAIFDGKSHMRALDPGNWNSLDQNIVLAVMPAVVVGTKVKRGAIVCMGTSVGSGPILASIELIFRRRRSTLHNQ